MSDYDNYGELLERNADVVADEEREAELVEWELELLADRLHRDDPIMEQR
jgi:hypothetical protein